ncbi:MAG: hypothetical protein WCC74_00535 [Minisyncoccia bacterium]
MFAWSAMKGNHMSFRKKLVLCEVCGLEFIPNWDRGFDVKTGICTVCLNLNPGFRFPIGIPYKHCQNICKARDRKTDDCIFLISNGESGDRCAKGSHLHGICIKRSGTAKRRKGNCLGLKQKF